MSLNRWNHQVTIDDIRNVRNVTFAHKPAPNSWISQMLASISKQPRDAITRKVKNWARGMLQVLRKIGYVYPVGCGELHPQHIATLAPVATCSRSLVA